MELNLLNLFKNVDNPIPVATKETIFSEGEPGDTMYVLLKGDAGINVGDRPP